MIFDATCSSPHDRLANVAFSEQKREDILCVSRMSFPSVKPAQISEEVKRVFVEATQNRLKLHSLREDVISGLNNGQRTAQDISLQFSQGMKQFVAGLYEEGIKKLGPPPCEYCVATMGSMARGESGPYPDFDNFIIVETASESNKAYFTRLNQYVADRIVRLGEPKGFRLCPGFLNAPYQRYEHRYATDKSRNVTGGRSELLTTADECHAELGDIYDSDPIIGDRTLYDRFMSLAKNNNSQEVVLNNIRRGVNDLKRDNSSPIASSTISLPEWVNIKANFFRFPQTVLTSLALHYGIEEKNSFDRIRILQEKGIFTPDFAHKLSQTMEHLIRFRIQTQSAYREEFEWVSTGTRESLQRNKEIIGQKIKRLEGEMTQKYDALARELPSVKEALANTQQALQKLEEVPQERPETLQRQVDELQESLFTETLHCCEKESLSLKDSVKEDERNRAEMIRQMFLGLMDVKRQKESYREWLDPRIEANQYPPQGAPEPRVKAFTEKDKEALQCEVIPTLRELYFMASESNRLLSKLH